MAFGLLRPSASGLRLSRSRPVTPRHAGKENRYGARRSRHPLLRSPRPRPHRPGRDSAGDDCGDKRGVRPLLYGDGVIPTCRPRCTILNTFVSKLDPTGSALVYSTFRGDHRNTQGTAIAADTAG